MTNIEKIKFKNLWYCVFIYLGIINSKQGKCSV